MENCKISDENLRDFVDLMDQLLEIHLSKLEHIPCLYCEKFLANFEDLMHHVSLNHQGLSQELLHNGTLARETKKRIGNYLGIKTKDVGMECPVCFEIFSEVEKLSEHSLKQHARELKPEFLKKMKRKIKNIDDKPPTCEMCKKIFIGVVFTKIKDRVTNVCFNCYEDYFGATALNRITIGTTDEMIEKMRTPL